MECDTLSDLYTVRERSSTSGSVHTAPSNINDSVLCPDAVGAVQSTRGGEGRGNHATKRPDQNTYARSLLNFDPVASYLELCNGRYDVPCCNKRCLFVRNVQTADGGALNVLCSDIFSSPAEVALQKRHQMAQRTQKERGDWVMEELRHGIEVREQSEAAPSGPESRASETNSSNNIPGSSENTQNSISDSQKKDFSVRLSVHYVGGNTGEQYRASVCASTWRFLNGVGRTMFYRKLKTLKEDQITVSAINAAIARADKDQPECQDVSAMTLEMIAFVREFAQQFGEHNPTRQETRINFDRVDVYECFKKRYPERKVMGLSTFYRIWNKHLADIRKCAWTGDHLKCHVCLSLAKEDCNPHLSSAEHEKIRVALQDHRATVMEARLEYWLRREKGIRYPGQFLSIIIDGCDQKKTHLPCFKIRAKDSERFEKYCIAHKLVGVIVHGMPNNVYTYFVPANCAKRKGSNLTIEVLQRTLWKERLRREEMGALWPEVLFLQMDNTAAENKNKYIFAYLSALIKKGVFKQIYVNFLPVGHTHEDIDQFFSQFAYKMRAQDCFTFDDVVQVLQKCHDPSTQVLKKTEYLFMLHNWRSWLEDELVEAYTGYLSNVFHFRLQWDEALGKVACQYQAHSFNVSGVDGEKNYLPKAPYEPQTWLKADPRLDEPPKHDSSAGSWEFTPYFNMAREELKKKAKEDLTHDEVVNFLVQKLEKLLSFTSNAATDEHIGWWKDWLQYQMPQPGDELADALTCPEMFQLFEPYVLPEGTTCVNNYYNRTQYQGVPAAPLEDDVLLFTGHTHAQRAQTQRIQQELLEAQKSFSPIEKNTFVIFMVSEGWKDLGSTQKGLNADTTSLPFTLGKAMDNENTCTAEATVRVHVYYTRSGDPNDPWKPWIHQGRGQRKWVITISRECIVLVDVKLTQKGNLTRPSKKSLGEVPGFPYLYVPTLGLVTKEKAIQDLEKQLQKLRRKKDVDSVAAANGVETRLCHIRSLLVVRDRNFTAHALTEDELHEVVGTTAAASNSIDENI